MHDAFIVGVPLIAILAGILLNRQDISSLRNELRSEIGSVRSDVRSDISSLRSEMNSRFDSIQRDMREFYGEQSRHEVRISALEQQK